MTAKISELPKHSYAVIIDEAHSLAGRGECNRLKDLAKAVVKEEMEKYLAENPTAGSEEEIILTMLKRGRQKNISFSSYGYTQIQDVRGIRKNR